MAGFRGGAGLSDSAGDGTDAGGTHASQTPLADRPAVPAWRTGGEFSIGAEDELLLVDEDARLLGSSAGALWSALRRHTPAAGTIKHEVFVDEVELESPVCGDAEELMASLARLRESLTLNGARAMAIGVHPAGEFGTAHITSSRRYDRIGAEFAGLLRTPTASFQMHVGLPDPNAAVLAYRGLRNRLSVLRALAAGSPYWHGRDSGLACARPAILRSYPRTTMPPELPSWAAYVETMEQWMSADEVPDHTYVCWELRLQPRLGTIEVRVMDAQPSLARAAGLAALVQGLARHAVEAPDGSDLPDHVVLANDFRACRHGLEATVLDTNAVRRPMREIATEAVDDAARALAPDGLDRPLEVVRRLLAEPPEYTRQRELCALRGMPALLADLVARTTDLGG